MPQQHVAPCLDVDWAAQRCREVLDAAFELDVGRAGDDVDRLHVDCDEEFSQSDELVGVSDQGNFLSMEVLVHVGDHVHQLAALSCDRVGHLHAGHAT